MREEFRGEVGEEGRDEPEVGNLSELDFVEPKGIILATKPPPPSDSLEEPWIKHQRTRHTLSLPQSITLSTLAQLEQWAYFTQRCMHPGQDHGGPPLFPADRNGKTINTATTKKNSPACQQGQGRFHTAVNAPLLGTSRTFQYIVHHVDVVESSPV